MADYVLDTHANKTLASEIDTSHEWSPKQLSEYLTRQGLGEYSECIVDCQAQDLGETSTTLE